MKRAAKNQNLGGVLRVFWERFAGLRTRWQMGDGAAIIGAERLDKESILKKDRLDKESMYGQ